jgi:hypothetical protein
VQQQFCCLLKLSLTLVVSGFKYHCLQGILLRFYLYLSPQVPPQVRQQRKPSLSPVGIQTRSRRGDETPSVSVERKEMVTSSTQPKPQVRYVTS